MTTPHDSRITYAFDGTVITEQMISDAQALNLGHVPPPEVVAHCIERIAHAIQQQELQSHQ
jgi:hypothetical protein